MKEHKYRYQSGDGSRVFRKTVLKRYSGFLVGFTIMLIGSIALIAESDEKLIAGIGIGISLSYFCNLYWAYRSSKAAFDSVIYMEQIIRVSDEHIEFENENVNTKIKWKSILELWKIDDLWAFTISGRPYYQILPIQKIPDETLAMLERNIVVRQGRIIT